MIEEYYLAPQAEYDDRVILIKRSGTPPNIEIKALAANNREAGWFRINRSGIYPQEVRQCEPIAKEKAVAILLQSRPVSEEHPFL